MHAVHAETAGPKYGRSDGPVVLRATVLCRRRVDSAVAIAQNGGCGRYVVMTTVAPANLVVGGNLMVQLDVELPAWIGAQNDLTEVGRRVGRARYVGVRVQIQNRLSDGVDL